MKKTFHVLLFILSGCLIFATSPENILSPAMLKTGVWGDFFPITGFSTQNHEAKNYDPDANDFERFAEQPAFSSPGFSVARGPFALVMILEAQTDFGQWMQGDSMSNLPLTSDGSAIRLGTVYPQVGYIEGKGDGWFVSAGRRSVVVGPSTSVSLGVSRWNPWYDHVIAEISSPWGMGSIGYTAMGLGVRRIGSNASTSANADLGGKLLLMHRFSYNSSLFSFGISEYNLLAGVIPDFEDLNPFLVAHHLFATGSNIMLQFDMSWNPVDDFRLYGEFLLDDFQLPSESRDSNPNAMGFSVGTEWRINESRAGRRPAFFRHDYGIRVGESPLGNGLILRFEGALASTYLYRRNSVYPDQVIRTRYYIVTASDFKSLTVNSFFANPLGPDRMKFVLTLSQSGKKLLWEAGTSFTILGSDSDKTVYKTPYRSFWPGPQTPLRLEYGLNACVFYCMNGSSGLYARLDQGYSQANDFGMGLSVGFVQRFLNTDSSSVDQ